MTHADRFHRAVVIAQSIAAAWCMVAATARAGILKAQTPDSSPLFSAPLSSFPLPSSRLAVRTGGRSRLFWTSEAAPVRWTIAPLADAMRWQHMAPGVALATLQLAGTGEAWRTRLVVVRLDPAQLTFTLDTALSPARRPAWNVKRASRDAVFAMNAGQFRDNRPWGLLILDGRRTLPPERGPLAITVAIDSSSATHWTFDDEAAGARAQWAFQSYPVLLRHFAVPTALQGAARGIDVAHRDARLALGRQPDGCWLVAITRFDGLGEALGSIPFGLTVPEMAAVMGALGAQDAVLLDGGISAQLMAGSGAGRVLLTGWRDVPLGLVARPRGAPGR